MASQNHAVLILTQFCDTVTNKHAAAPKPQHSKGDVTIDVSVIQSGPEKKAVYQGC